ncbi:FAD-dependent oxidoreductase [Acidimicrobiaceae bacterium USS-CC1]|uniref:FAD-dependent oxidoreductase n=1 Tax=Acidiferrimicrobium australe TaxID=2664430 RepID=A0ABW9QSW6_9ACTN|nr:FAD-dependent oxidoreductase [Acidiferrimicrobium australe]
MSAVTTLTGSSSAAGRRDGGWERAAPISFWMDDPAAPPPLPPLDRPLHTELAVVGGGFSGLWTALLAKQADPGLDVVLLEGERVAWAATGRNGGFCEASLTHGEPNGRNRFPDEYEVLARLGQDNLEAIDAFVRQRRLDCGWERTGTLSVATEAWQVDELRGGGPQPEDWLDAAALRAEVDSPTYLAGRWDRDGGAIVNPARLAWGLRDACLEAGVRIFEQTTVEGLERSGRAVALATAGGQVLADRVALGTNAFPSLLRRVRPRIVPVYDHVLMTEPLSDEQLGRIGWRNRQGIADAGNQFHYYRLTTDNRILWGGYDAIYHFGKQVRPAYDQRPATFRKLARHFFETFPQLEDVGFTHRWGGAIDTCSRFCAFFGTALGGRVAYAAGYTGVGVGATRFGAQVMLDLLAGARTERTSLQMVRSKPLPFPPEPLGWVVIEATRRSIAAADAHEGQRNAWLRLLDRIGLGFDS